MKKLAPFLAPYKKESVLGPLFKLLEASFELLVPLVMASIIDRGIGSGDRGHIARMCVLLVALGAVGLVCSLTAQYFAAKAAVGFSARLRHALFAKIQSLSFGALDRIGATTLITRLTSDINLVQNGLNMVLRLFLRSPFIVLGAMVMAFTVDWQAALVFVVTIPVLSVVVFAIMLVSIPLYRKVQQRLDRLLGLTRETLTGARVLRAFGKEEDETADFREKNGALVAVQQFVGRISGLMNPLTYVVINAATLALLWTGAIRVDGGFITQGAVVALVNYMSQILVELVKLANLIITVTKSVACAGRLEAVLELPGGLSSPAALPDGVRPDPEAPAVSFEHCSLRYGETGDLALSDIHFSAAPGETIGLIGGTGSGKSSVVNLIPRFYDPTEGSVRLSGVDARDYPLEQLRRKIGLVPQKAVLFQGTVRENLLWGRADASDEELLEALRAAQALDFVEERGGLSSPVSQGGRNLSGGQRQRLTIARALVRSPEILILDDSASALDFATDARLRRAIRELPGRMTVFIVSQRAASVRHADRIVVLDDGQIVGLGDHDTLLRSCPVYQEIYYSQFPKEVDEK